MPLSERRRHKLSYNVHVSAILQAIIHVHTGIHMYDNNYNGRKIGKFKHNIQMMDGVRA